MKKEINFYEVDEGVVKSMGPILLKILDEKKNAFIFVKNVEKIKDISLTNIDYNITDAVNKITTINFNNKPI